MGALEITSAGGSEFVAPRALDVQQFAVARAAEVQSLYSSLKERTSAGTLATPRHLRRRTNSHNRRKSFFWNRKQKKETEAAPGDGADGEQENGGSGEDTDKVAKPPCRKVRRRMELKGDPRGGGGKTRDGTQRLVTHVWHAKRFKMKNMWGHWLAEGFTGRGKGSRAVIRWANDSALIHDASYHTPLELEGPAGAILDVLCAVLDPHPPNLDAASEFEQAEFFGARYGNAVLHQAGKFPSETIGPISYMWRPVPAVSADLTEAATRLEEKSALSCSCTRYLWIWIHAACVVEAFDSLQTACKSQGGVVSCRLRSDEFGRIDILGSGANEVLQKVIHPFYRPPRHVGNCETNSREASGLGDQAGTAFLTEHRKSSKAACSKLLAFAERLPNRAVVAMDVHDPRDPPKWVKNSPRPTNAVESPSRCKGEDEASVGKPCLPLEAFVENLPPGQIDDICMGDQDYQIAPEKPAWDIPGQVENFAAAAYSRSSEDGSVKDPMSLWWELLEKGAIWNELSDDGHPMSEQALSSYRHQRRLSYHGSKAKVTSKGILPGRDASCKRRCPGCPLLLLKHEHKKPSACRWSIIMPISWIRAFWVPLVFAGGHVIGVRELRWLTTDAGLSSYPFDYPDCAAYTDYVNEKSASLLEYNKKRPSGSQVVPFFSPWNFGAVSHQHATSAEKGSMQGTSVPVEARSSDLNNPLSTSSCELHETDGGVPQVRSLEVELEAASQDQSGNVDSSHFVGAGHLGPVFVESYVGASNGLLGKADHTHRRLNSSQQVDGAGGVTSSCNGSASPPIVDSADLVAASGTTSSSFVARTRLLIHQALAVENLAHLPICSEDTCTQEAFRCIFRIKGGICFVRVSIQTPRKGSIEEGALVCLPSSNDTDAWFSTCDRWQGYHVPNKKTHKRRGQDCKRKGRQIQADETREPKRRRVEHNAVETQCDLGVEPVTPALATERVMELGTEHREPVGFVTSAGVRGSFSRMAVGFCDLVKLGKWRAAQLVDIRWKNTKEISLLVRNPCSTVYRPAMATVVLEEADYDL